jgi:hypothetical protein
MIHFNLDPRGNRSLLRSQSSFLFLSVLWSTNVPCHFNTNLIHLTITYLMYQWIFFAKELTFWNKLWFTKKVFGEMLWIQVKWVGIVVSEVWGLWIVKLDKPFNIYCIVLIKGIWWVHEHWSVKYDIIVDMVLLIDALPSSLIDSNG